MCNENNSIHDFDFSLICEYFSSISRQGPGSEEITKQALQFIKGLDDDSKIADIGCGTGTQTLTIAQNAKGHITAYDLFPQFVDQLNEHCAELGLQHRIKGLVGDMAQLPISEASLDLIWCEGAIYNIGFQNGLRQWRRFLKKGGYIAVSEPCWLTEERPEEITRFWNDAYPEVDLVSRKIAQMEAEGYTFIASFLLPDECWTDHFYLPQQEAQRKFLLRHPDNPIAQGLVENMRHEAEMFSRYHQYYGYVFFIGQTNNVLFL